MAKLKKVKIVRSHKRLGVLGARVLGYRNAKGPVIVSFDSHVEPIRGWLEPLLDRIKDDPKRVVWPKVHGSSSKARILYYTWMFMVANRPCEN